MKGIVSLEVGISLDFNRPAPEAGSRAKMGLAGFGILGLWRR
jgi:MYXO-CTERM domain-containing protein